MINRPCRECGTPTPYTYCREHGGDGRQARAVRNGTNKRRWRNLRVAVLKRDGYECRLKLSRCTLVANTVHLDPALKGNHDLATMEDCVSACRSCHGTVDAARSHENR